MSVKTSFSWMVNRPTIWLYSWNLCLKFFWAQFIRYWQLILMYLVWYFRANMYLHVCFSLMFLKRKALRLYYNNPYMLCDGHGNDVNIRTFYGKIFDN